MKFDGTTLEALLQRDNSSKLVLPNFQRDFVWSKPAQRDLLASFVADIPIGSILLLQGKKGDFASRPLAFDDSTDPAYECQYLLDGQQRIASLKMAFSDVFAGTAETGKWLPIWENVFGLLQNRWFLRVVPEGSEELDLFGWKSLRFDTFPSDLTPQNVAPLIEYRRINKTRPDDWHHPHFQHLKFPDDSEDKRRLKIGRAAAEDGLVPLWEVFGHDASRSDPVHFHALREIATSRQAELRSETHGNQEAWIEILKPIDPSIEEYLADARRIDEAWSTLRVRWIERVADRIETLVHNSIPVAQVPPNQPERAIAIFENINLGGTELTVFDLIVAKAALGAEEAPSLRRQIVEQLQEELELPGGITDDSIAAPEFFDSRSMSVHDDEAPAKITKNQYLNLLSILGHLDYPNPTALRVEHIKKTKQLELTADGINKNTIPAVSGLQRAFAFLHFRCGVVRVEDISYDLMVLPLAYCLRDDTKWTDPLTLDKLEYWFWASLFGGAYRERQNPRCVEDIKQLNDWVRGEVENPFEGREERVMDVEDYSDKDTLLLRRVEEAPPPAAIRDGIIQLVLRFTPQDLLPPEQFAPQHLATWKVARESTFQDLQGKEYVTALEKHHIIPLASATKLGESSDKLRKNSGHLLNSPLNLTPISGTANRMIRARPPEDYVRFLDDLSLPDHVIPHDLADKFLSAREEGTTSHKQMYEALLSERFDMFKIKLLKHLRELIGSDA